YVAGRIALDASIDHLDCDAAAPQRILDDAGITSRFGHTEGARVADRHDARLTVRGIDLGPAKSVAVNPNEHLTGIGPQLGEIALAEDAPGVVLELRGLGVRLDESGTETFV